MLSTPVLLGFGLTAATLLVILIIGYMRPHRADTTRYKHENWVIPPTLFRYAFWFGILASLIMAMLLTVSIYQVPQ